MTNALFWRPIPILTLTVRQFLGGKSLWVVTALSFVPCLFAGIYLIDSTVAAPREFLADEGGIFLGLVSPTLLPIAVLILATGALGNEVEDRTLPYLVLKPVTRPRIVVEKFVGVVLVALPAVLAGLVVTYLMVDLGGDESVIRAGDRSGAAQEPLGDVLWAMVAAASVGVAATAAVFLFISLVIPRALLVGIVYAFAWESLLGRFLPGIKTISIRHYTDSVFYALLDEPESTIDPDLLLTAASLNEALITIAALVVVGIALATWRLRTMNLE